MTLSALAINFVSLENMQNVIHKILGQDAHMHIIHTCNLATYGYMYNILMLIRYLRMIITTCMYKTYAN